MTACNSTVQLRMQCDGAAHRRLNTEALPYWQAAGLQRSNQASPISNSRGTHQRSKPQRPGLPAAR